MHQCADTPRIARGRGPVATKPRPAVVERLVWSAFIGLPWPKNAAGIAVVGAVSVTAPSLPRTSGCVAPTPRRRVAQQRLEEAVDTARGDRHQLLQARHRPGEAGALRGHQVDRLVVADRGEGRLERDEPVDE